MNRSRTNLVSNIFCRSSPNKFEFMHFNREENQSKKKFAIIGVGSALLVLATEGEVNIIIFQNLHL